EALPAAAPVPDIPEAPIEAERAAPPADTVPPSADAFHPFEPEPRDAPRPVDAPMPATQAGSAFDDLDPPLAAEPQAPPSDPADVFSDLFGPGTLPVGSVPDVSAHPFDMESAQTRNPEDPLRQLPRGDANVRGPARDPLDLLGSPDDDDTRSVFSDQTPSTLPAHDPLAPHRSDPVTDTLNPRERDDGAHAARDHLREYGSHLRPARVQSQDSSGKGPDKPPRK
ncbi:hypothetical protein LPZ50_22880, partial [Bordetella petrii]|nr:hypothetical protein [Bordetella petrii]